MWAHFSPASERSRGQEYIQGPGTRGSSDPARCDSPWEQPQGLQGTLVSSQKEGGGGQGSIQHLQRAVCWQEAECAAEPFSPLR